MTGKKKNISGNSGRSINLALILLLASFFPVTLVAQTSSVILNKPVTQAESSQFGRRTDPVTGAKGKMHNGIDYRTPLGTKITTTVPVFDCRTTSQTGGYGNQAIVKHACGVTERYNHLQTCNGVKGNTTLSTGSTGKSTGPHLHYEIMIEGAFVDPKLAYGKNLCDGAVRKMLLDDARQKGASGGGGGASAGSNKPAPTPPAPTTPTTPTTPPPGTPAGTPPPEDLELPILPPTVTDVVPPATEETTNELTGCATDTWRAMVNQAVLQTRREMVMNQRYIAKADSVFAYSCFKDTIAHAGKTLGVFSTSQDWVNRQTDLDGGSVTVNKEMGQFSLEGALINAAIQPYQDFVSANFSHGFLGDTPEPLSATQPEEEEEEEEDSHGHSGDEQVDASCNTMSKVWAIAKCMNVNDDPLFYRFEDLIDRDPRQYPHNMPCFDTGITQDMIDIARNKSTDAAKKTEFSAVDMHFTVLMPDDETCAPPIITGVEVFRREGADQITAEISYPDGLCITPGCSYQNAVHSGAGTCEVKGPNAPAQAPVPVAPPAPAPAP